MISDISIGIGYVSANDEITDPCTKIHSRIPFDVGSIGHDAAMKALEVRFFF
jgi:hypothetical protein